MKTSTPLVLLYSIVGAFSSPTNEVRQTITGPVDTLFPHYLVPLQQDQPETAFGTQYTGTVKWTGPDGMDETSLIVGFDVPDNGARTCVLKFRLPIESQPNWELDGHGHLDYYGLSRIVYHLTDTWNTRPERSPLSPLGQLQVVPGGEGITTGTFPCNLGTRMDFELTARQKGPMFLNWFELEVPKTGVTMEMYL